MKPILQDVKSNGMLYIKEVQQPRPHVPKNKKIVEMSEERAEHSEGLRRTNGDKRATSE